MVRQVANSQRGSALLYVFIGVVLFGSLMFMYSRSAQDSSGKLTKHQASIDAAEVINYAQAVNRVVQRLLMNGCSETQISFENNFESGYTNASAPVDLSCHVFSPKGVQYKYPPTGAESNYTAGAQPGYHNYAFNGNMIIDDIGTNAPELIMWSMTNKEVCDEINAMIEKTTADDTFGDGIIGGEFTGSFGTAGPGTIGDESYPAAIPQGCFNRPTYAGQYIFYSVLISR